MKQEDGNRIRCLDGLKGIGACIIAFIWHYQHFQPQKGEDYGMETAYIFGEAFYGNISVSFSNPVSNQNDRSIFGP